MKTTFDLIIIGGGAGAFGAAIRANELHADTAVINGGLPLGGTCVNVGCVPSKTLLYAGEILHLARHHGIPGIDIEIKNFDFQKVVQDELALVEMLRKEKYDKVFNSLKHATFFEGKAQFISKNEVDVNGRILKGDKFIIATGSTTSVPPIEGIHDVGFLTHIEALKLEKQPKELIVIGAGPLGLEFGQMYARFGTKVTILERLNTVFPPSEKELVDRLAQVIIREGITVRTGVTVKMAWKQNGKKILSYVADGKEEEVSGDEILLATGKTSNTQGLGLKNAGVEIDKRQVIIVNRFMQTSQPHIFAAGDVINLPLRLEITAGHEGTLAAENALSDAQKGIDYDTVPYTIFTDPQLAGVGFTEEEQMRKIGVCECRTVSFADVPKAIITKRTEGLIKMAIHPETRQIMGVHILAPYAGELIAEAMMLVRNKNTVDDVVDSLPMFPTLSESIKLAALSFTKDISKLSCCV
ncbi:MAG: mercury(II) reductase [Nitrospiraceae bacterium]|nr:mercury(II) reductase [Nitrospiraceae bacterium]